MNKKQNFADRFLYFIIDNYLYWICIALILIISLVIRIGFAPDVAHTSDYHDYLVPWVEAYRLLGAKVGLAQNNITTYYIPYNTFLAIVSNFNCEPWLPIAVVSIFFDYVIAFATYKIVALLRPEKKVKGLYPGAAFVAAMTLFLPEVLFNSSLAKQCDAVYAAFALIGLYYLLKDKYGRAYFFLGIGFAFKLQALFLMPVFLLVYIAKRNHSVKYMLWVPAWYLIGGLPAILCGADPIGVYKIYLDQTNGFGMIAMNIPNIYKLGLTDYALLESPGLWFTLAIFVAAGAYCYRHQEKIDRVMIYYLAGWCVWTCVEFLPDMHERYGFMASVIIPVFMLVFNRKYLWSAVVLTFCTLFIYGYYVIEGNPFPLPVEAVAYTAAYLAVTVNIARILNGKEMLSEAAADASASAGKPAVEAGASDAD